MEFVILSTIALWVVAALEAVAILVLVRQIGLLYRRLPPVGARMDANGPGIGDLVRPMIVTSLAEDRIEVGGPGRRQLLVFVAPNCTDCADLAPALRSVWGSDLLETDLTVISIDGDPDANRSFVSRYGLGRVPFALSPRAGIVYGVSSTPYALLIDAEGRLVQKGVVNHLEHLESLLEYRPSISAAAT
jgi:methylamine dehydrogenase accessory protein MauD